MHKLIIFVVLSVTFNMAIDKSWIRLPDRLCAEYQAGVKAFVESAGIIRMNTEKFVVHVDVVMTVVFKIWTQLKPIY